MLVIHVLAGIGLGHGCWLIVHKYGPLINEIILNLERMAH